MKTATVVKLALATNVFNAFTFAQNTAPAPASVANVTWKRDMVIVEETIKDPRTGKDVNWTVQFDWNQGRHVEIVAKTSSTTTTLSFLGNNGGLYMIEIKGGPLPEFWNKSNGVHYLDSLPQPNSPTVPDTTKQNIRPALQAIFSAADAATKDTPSWSLERRYPGLRAL